MKKLVCICVMIIAGTVTSYGQDEYVQNDPPLEMEDQAQEITDQYNAQLSMTGKQQLLFKKKVVEFLIRRDKIEKEYQGREMLNKMLLLSKQETAEMGDVLTRPQLQLYREIKMQIQPLTTVDD